MNSGKRRGKGAVLWARGLLSRPHAIGEHMKVLVDAIFEQGHRVSLPARYFDARALSEISQMSDASEVGKWGRAASAIMESGFPKLIESHREDRRLRAYPLEFDGDPGFLSLLHTIVALERPSVAVETGVANGASSAVLLSALNQNSWGRLYSIDACEEERLGRTTGRYVDDFLRERWELVAGTSDLCLGPLLDRVGPLDLFIHDSLHTYRNMTFELEIALRNTRDSRFIIVADDIEKHTAFSDFADRNHLSWEVFSHEQKQGLFGIAYRPPGGETAKSQVDNIQG
jgi:predicted O-methyltransferase YrrM